MNPGRLIAEGTARFERWRATQSAADLEAAIALLAELDAAAAADPGLRFVADMLMALALADRFKLSDSVGDIDGVIERLKRMLSHPDPPPGLGPAEMDAFRVALGRASANRLDLYGRPGGPPPVGDDEYLDELRTAVDGLAVAARTSSELVTAAERAEAAALRAHLVPRLVLTRSILSRKAGALADLAELERVLSGLPADNPNRAQLILELGFAHMHLLLRPGARLSSGTAAKHRAAAAEYLSQAVELLNPGYLERPKALAFLSYLSLTRPPGSPRAAAGSASELAERGLAEPGLDPVMGAVLRLLSGMTAGPASAPGDLAAAASQLGRALGLARDLGKPRHPGRFEKALRVTILGAFRGLLSSPVAVSPSLEDRDAADAYGRQLLQLMSEDALLEEVAEELPELAGAALAVAAPLRSGRAASERLNAAFLAGDLAGVDAALAELQDQLAGLAPDHELRWMLLAQVGAGWHTRGALSGLLDDSVRGLEILVSALDQAGESAPVMRLVSGAEWTARQRAAAAAAELGRLTRDHAALTAATRRMAELRGAPGATEAGQAGLARLHGQTLLWRHDLTGDPRDLDEAIAMLEEAGRQAGDEASHGLLRDLSAACWTRGDRARGDQDRARAAGLRALRQRAAAVLLQSGAENGLRMARADDVEKVIQLVSWCLAEGRPDQAVAVLEQSRAVVLHAATVTAGIPALLRRAGYDRLADEWQAALRDIPARVPDLLSLLGPEAASQPGDPWEPRIPSLLRREVLAALADAELLAVPGLAELGAALRLAGADALAYLIPPLQGDGLALVVHADGETDRIALPGLSAAGPVEAYELACQAAARDDGEGARLAFRDALEALCDWAWDAATAPVLRCLARHQPGRESRHAEIPRVVLIPVGRLGIVPWHAARTAGPDGTGHYAVRDAVFSYAASAGQFAWASRRAAPSWAAAPLLLSNPTDDLAMAQLEVAELARRYYPDAAFLGLPAGLADGPGMPAEVLSRLPGGWAPPASLVHCGCHATIEPSPAASRLLLAEGRSLSVAEILAQAQGRDPAGRGFLAVLSACMTDLASADHDEALTLASALLAAGAAAVVGTRWPTEDACTALVMVMFHHFLNNGHPRPADALRAAQLWMIDGARAPLGDLPPELAGIALLDRVRAAPYVWAAFTCHGA